MHSVYRLYFYAYICVRAYVRIRTYLDSHLMWYSWPGPTTNFVGAFKKHPPPYPPLLRCKHHKSSRNTGEFGQSCSTMIATCTDPWYRIVCDFLSSKEDDSICSKVRRYGKGSKRKRKGKTQQSNVRRGKARQQQKQSKGKGKRKQEQRQYWVPKT